MPKLFCPSLDVPYKHPYDQFLDDNMISYSLSVPELYISHKIMEQKSNGTLNKYFLVEYDN